MLTDPALILFISALSGAVGALLLRSLFKLTGKLLSERLPVAVYRCAVHDTGPGGLHHGWGGAEMDEVASGGDAWAHGANQVSVFKREHTIFGPYTNDFGRPGYYKVTFRLRGRRNFPKTDAVVAVLDVVRAPFAYEKDLILIGQRVIRAREMKNSYRAFNIYCYYSGVGIYEYRCCVKADKFNISENSVLFDTIKVYRHFPIWDIL
jgi:hypothetical protein